MADNKPTSSTPTGNAFLDALNGLAGVGASILNTAATFQERILAAKASAKQATTVTVPVTTSQQTAADNAEQLKLWAEYAAVTGGILLVMFLAYKKLK